MAADLTNDQTAAIKEWTAVLPHLSLSPLRTIYSCDTCRRWGLLQSGDAPARCNLTWGCEGHISKGSKPKKLPVSSWLPPATVTTERFAELGSKITDLRNNVIDAIMTLAKHADPQASKVVAHVESGLGWASEHFELRPEVFTGKGESLRQIELTSTQARMLEELTLRIPINPDIHDPLPWLSHPTIPVRAAASSSVHTPQHVFDLAMDSCRDFWLDALVDDWRTAVAQHMFDTADRLCGAPASQIILGLNAERQLTTQAVEAGTHPGDLDPAGLADLASMALALDPRWEPDDDRIVLAGTDDEPQWILDRSTMSP